MGATPQRILALLPNWVGDAAMVTPALRALANAFPDAQLVAAGRGSACALIDGLPYVSRTIVLSRGKGLLGALEQGRVLRPYSPDLAVVFTHSFRGALLARLSGARRRVGYERDGRGWLLTDRIPPHRQNGRIQPIYMTREYLELVEAIGCVDDGRGLELVARPADVATANACVNGNGPKVGIAPGAAFGPSKLWPADRFAKVADALAERAGAQCILLTGPGEEASRDAVLNAARTPLLRCDGGNPTLGTLKATIAQLDLLVCNDSGSRHVAVAFGVPVVCLMGPTAPCYSEGPYERGRVLRIDVDCGPCQKPVCATDHRCMTGIAAEEVVATALEWLQVRHGQT